MPTAFAVAGFALFLWALPLSHMLTASPLSGHDHARLLQLLVLASVCVRQFWLATWHGTSFRAHPIPVGRIAYLVVLGGLIAASAAHATYPLIALKELLLFAGLLALSKTITQMMVQERSFQLLFRALVAGALVYAGSVLILIFLALAAGGAFDPWGALIGFDNPRFLNHAQTAALPMIAIVAVSDPDSRWRRAALLTLVLSGMLLFLSFGRATVLALTVGLLTARWAFGSRANGYALRALLPTVLGMLLMWVIYLQWMRGAGYSIEVDQLTKAHNRAHLIEQALKLWKTSPWWGVGPMHFSHWEDGDAAHPHNIYVQVLAEYGAPAFILLFAGAATWSVKQLRALARIDPERTATAVGLWGALVGVMVDGAFSGNFVMPVSQLWIALTIGLVTAFVSMHRLATDHNEALAVPVARRGLVHAAGASLLLLGVASLFVQSALLCWRTPFPSMETSGPIQGEWRVETASTPRFWSNGFF